MLTKDFWRAALEDVGARVPQQVGRWVPSDRCPLQLPQPEIRCDLVIKVPDGYLGIGDSFWNYNKDFSSTDQLREMLQHKYPSQEVMLLELVRPKKQLGVHSLDIITTRTPEGHVKVLNVLLWTDCTTDSSHSCRAGYTVDVDTEMVIAPISWYSVAFGNMKTPLSGTKFPAVRKACEQAVAAHVATGQDWLVAVGWDCMVVENDDVVFFEGNFAGARTPRRMFLTWG